VDFGGKRAVAAAELQGLGEALAHRGPDDSGWYLDGRTGRCGLAHRRLAVIDVAGGKQPMSNEDGRVWAVYNGECYNFQELRGELEKQGHRFRTRSDTEAVVHLYEQRGAGCVEAMRGMFALAVWDERRGQLFLARDRLGKKPLYYTRHEGRFIFASECKALVQVAGMPRTADRQAVLHYLLLGYVPGPRSAFAGIRQLPAAHVLTVEAGKGETAAPKRYWSLPTEEGYAGTRAQAAEEVRATLEEAVRLRLVSDVPLGAFLSGGLDSTIVVGLMRQAGQSPIRTCSIGFREEGYNELEWAGLVARLYETEHHEHVVGAECLETIEKLSYHFDEPFADSSALPTYHLCRAARGHVTVALSGDGGDECFGGYDRYRALAWAERVRRGRVLRFLARQRLWHLLPAGEHHSRWHRLRRLLAGANLPPARRYLKWVSVFDPDLLAELCSEEWLAQGVSAEALWTTLDGYFPPGAGAGGGAERLIRQAMLADGRMYLAGDINTKVDRASMAVGLEVRCPFQDQEVMELAYRLPTAWRHDGRVSKVILREACRDLVPKEVGARRKMGFGVPVGRWFRGELRALFRDVVLSPQALRRGYFYSRAIEKLLEENDGRRADHGARLWSLLMLELWHQRYIDGLPGAEAGAGKKEG